MVTISEAETQRGNRGKAFVMPGRQQEQTQCIPSSDAGYNAAALVQVPSRHSEPDRQMDTKSPCYLATM